MAKYEFDTLKDLFEHFEAFGVTAHDIQETLDKRSETEKQLKIMKRAFERYVKSNSDVADDVVAEIINMYVSFAERAMDNDD